MRSAMRSKFVGENIYFLWLCFVLSIKLCIMISQFLICIICMFSQHISVSLDACGLTYVIFIFTLLCFRQHHYAISKDNQTIEPQH